MAELALAIAPLCFTAIQGISFVRKKLKILRHHDSEIKRLRKKFIAQTDIFLDECQLLLQEFLDPREAELLVESPTDVKWKSPQLESQIKAFLGRKYSAFKEIVSDICSHMTLLHESLNSNVEDPSWEVDRKKSERIRGAIDVMINKSKYESIIDSFKEANQEMKRLRKTATKIQQCQAKACSKRPRSLPSSYKQTTQHSKSFYDALRSFWTCLQAQHTSHDVRLLLDSRHDGSLRVIVRYRTQSGFQFRDGLVDLLVRSQSLSLVHITIPTAGSSSASLAHTGEPPHKIKRARFSEDCTSSSNTTIFVKEPDEMTTSSLDTLSSLTPQNLCSAGDMCSQLCAQTRSRKCGGYFDTPDRLRHHLSPVCSSTCTHKDCLNTERLGEPTSLDQIFDLPVERSISVPEQVRLALKLVKGVLQFHSTPWLQPYWRLQDLSYFQIDKSLADSLGTLHISTELSQQQRQDSEMTEASSILAEAQMACGIRNLTMHSLGVALLQIGQWDPLKPDNIVELRKIANMAERDSRLGPRYQKITQQCLECDFGFGKDLEELELQSAIYRDVVCELEALIYTLEGKNSE